jgi:hypothetical protein
MMSRLLRILLVVLLVVALLFIVKAVTVGLALVELDDAVNDLLYMPETAEAFSDKTQRAFSAVGRTAAELEMFAPVLRLGGADGCALANMIAAADEFSTAGQMLNGLAAPAFDSYSQSSVNSVYIAGLRERWATLDRQANLNQLAAQEQRENCIANNRRLQAWQEAVEGLHFVLQTFVAVPWDQALADETSTLLLLNNSDEVRATGGFTTALIVVEIEDGYLNWRLLNSYSVDDIERYDYHPPAPLPQQRYMGLSKWTFRDANWSPDHREAAQVALQLYALDQQKPRPLNLITVNFTALHTLMRYVQSLQVGGETQTSDTIMGFIRQAWGFDSSMGSFDPNRKDFLQDVGYELLNALATELGPVEQARIGLALRDMLERRDVIAFSGVPELADWLATQGWDGALPNPAGDFLMVVDSNLGYNKMSAYADQTIRYTVDLRGEPQARLTLDYHNMLENGLDCTQYTGTREQAQAEGREPSYYDRAINCYWNYIRVLNPAGSRIEDYEVWAAPPDWFPFTFIENPAQIDALQIGTFGGFGTMLVVPVNENRQLWFEYALPANVITQQDTRQHYRLLIQKQPGTRPAALQVQITVPDNATITAPLPDENISIEGNLITFRQLFEKDVLIEVVYE